MAWQHCEAAAVALARTACPPAAAAVLMYMAHRVPPDDVIFSAGWEKLAPFVGHGDVPLEPPADDLSPAADEARRRRKAAQQSVFRAIAALGEGTKSIEGHGLISTVRKGHGGSRASYRLTLLPSPWEYKAPVEKPEGRITELRPRSADPPSHVRRTTRA